MSNKRQPAKDSRYTVSIIGCGKIGFGYDKGIALDAPATHFSAFHDSPFFQIVSIVEPNAAIRAAIEKQFGTRTYAAYSKWAEVERPDVVVVASPDITHDTLVTSLVELRPKFVFCEKPLSLDPERIREIVQLYAKNKIGLSINYSRRFMPEYRELKAALANKNFGKIQLATILYSRGFLHNGSHYIDLCNWLFGTPKKIIKESERKGLPGDNTVACTLMYPGGAEVRLLGIDSSPLTINEIDIVGDKGRVRIDTFGTITTYTARVDTNFKPLTFFVPTSEKRVSANSALTHAVQNIAEYLRNGTALLSPAKSDIKNASLLSHITNLPCQN